MGVKYTGLRYSIKFAGRFFSCIQALNRPADFVLFYGKQTTAIIRIKALRRPKEYLEATYQDHYYS